MKNLTLYREVGRSQERLKGNGRLPRRSQPAANELFLDIEPSRLKSVPKVGAGATTK